MYAKSLVTNLEVGMHATQNEYKTKCQFIVIITLYCIREDGVSLVRMTFKNLSTQ